MLLIIAEGLVSGYDKTKSTISPKEFAKEHIKCGRRKYDNSSAFYREYFGNDVEKLVKAIKEYQRLKSHKKEELYVASLLK